MVHDKFLLAALDEAWRARGSVAPNPAVGAVVVRGYEIISTGFHERLGEAHAEVNAVKTLPRDCSDMTIYITLEPCNHWGRTPPCTDAIIERGFKQVVFGFKDPNPTVSKNNSTEILKASGIEVIHYPLAEIDAFYESYKHWVQTGKPWVTAKIAQSLDGKIAGANNQRIQLSNAECHELTHQKRRHTDIILTSTQTVITDNPLLNARTAEGEVSKPIAIVGTRALDKTYHVYDKAAGVEHYNTNDLAFVIDDLGQKGYHDVWVEAGGRLFTALHQAGLVNRTYLYVTPKVIGPKGTHLYHTDGLFDAAKEVLYEQMDDNIKIQLEW